MDLLRDSSLDDDRLDAFILLLADPNTESNYVSLTGLLALLSEMGKAAQRAAPYIKPILFDEQASYPIRLAAMRTLRSMDALTPAAVPPLLQLMSVIGISDDPLANDTRRDIAETIGRIRPIEKPFAALRKASTSRDQATRSAAVHGLAWIGPEASLAIVQALQDPSEPVRISASEVLVGRSGTEAVPIVIQVMQDADPETLSIAAQTLSRLSGHNFGEDPDHWQEWWDEMVALMNAIDTKEEIVSALDHEEGAIRMYAIERAEQMGPQIVGAIPGLTRILENETGLSIRAAEALAAIGSDAVPALVQAVDSQEMVTSAGGMFGLCEIGPPAALEAVPALINKLRESELNYPYSLKVLVCVTEEYLGRDADAWEAWWAGQQ
jgi:HEAT repeat protein